MKDSEAREMVAAVAAAVESMSKRIDMVEKFAEGRSLHDEGLIRDLELRIKKLEAEI